jgi:hypothetical protein
MVVSFRATCSHPGVVIEIRPTPVCRNLTAVMQTENSQENLTAETQRKYEGGEAHHDGHFSAPPRLCGEAALLNF